MILRTVGDQLTASGVPINKPEHSDLGALGIAGAAARKRPDATEVLKPDQERNMEDDRLNSIISGDVLRLADEAGRQMLAKRDVQSSFAEVIGKPPSRLVGGSDPAEGDDWGGNLIPMPLSDSERYCLSALGRAMRQPHGLVDALRRYRFFVEACGLAYSDEAGRDDRTLTGRG